ncbi:MAG: hypothetical protein ACHQXA_04955 [Gemmatimonadales bacterium]
MKRAVALALIAIGHPAVVRGQSVWLDRSPGTMVALEAMRPTPAEHVTIGPGWVWFATAQVPVSRTAAFIAELPFVVNDASAVAPGSPRSTMGNPYVGFVLDRKERTSWYDVGIRLPMVDSLANAAAATGIFTDFDRFDAWTSHVVPISAHINYQSAESGAMTIVRVGPTLMIPTAGTGAPAESQLLLDIAMLGGYRNRRIDVRGGFTGRMQVSGTNGNVAGRLQVAAGVTLGVRLGSVEPTIGFRLPVFGQLKDFLAHVVTLGVTVHP